MHLESSVGQQGNISATMPSFPAIPKDNQPPTSKISKFRVPIGLPERWKIQSIANYKKQQAQKVFKARVRSTGGKVNERPTKGDGTHKINIPIEHLRKELDTLNSNSNVIRNKMVALCAVRTSLLWLLKKSNMVEREIIS